MALFNLLNSLFSENNAVFIRDSDSLNDAIDSCVGDLDLYVADNSFSEIQKFFFCNGWYNLFCHKYFLTLQNDIYGSLSLDIHSGVYERLPFLSASDFFLESHVVKGINYLPDYILLLVLLLHPLDLTGFRGQRGYSNQREKNIRGLAGNPVTLARAAEWAYQYISPSVSRLVEDLPATDINSYENRVWSIRGRMYLERPGHLKFLYKRLKSKIVKPSWGKGKIVAVMGVDGSGKTTLLDGLQKFIDRYYRTEGKAIRIYMGSLGGYFLPIRHLAAMKNKVLSLLLMRRQFSAPDCNELSGKPDVVNRSDRSRVVELVKGGFIALDYAFRFLGIFYQKQFRKRIVLTDRYVFDHVRGDVDSWVLTWLSKVFPEPDLILLVKGDCDVFFERKGEYCPDQLWDHQAKLDTFLNSRFPHTVCILDGNLPEHDVLVQACKALSGCR